MPKTDPLIVTPAETEISAPHPEWLAALKNPDVDLWAVIESLAARVQALEGTT